MEKVKYKKSLCVFCGSKNGNNLIYKKAARELGTYLAKNKIRLVYGGGSLGLMGELSISVNRNNGIEIPPLDLKQVTQNMDNLILCSDTSISNNLICNSSHTNSQSDGMTSIIITPRGTVAQGGLIKLNLEQSIKNRCIVIVQPLGLIRQGIEKNSNCNFNTAY